MCACVGFNLIAITPQGLELHYVPPPPPSASAPFGPPSHTGYQADETEHLHVWGGGPIQRTVSRRDAGHVVPISNGQGGRGKE